MTRDIRLPLTESSEPHASPRAEHLTEEAIGAIVDEFYVACRADPLLGPVFERHIKNWPKHLGVIRDFWSAALLKTARYSGRPIEAHEPLGLGAEHFARWMQLWSEVVRRHTTPHDASVVIESAAAMSRAMVHRGYLDRGPRA